MLVSLKLSHRFALLMAVVSIGFCLFGWHSYQTINKIQVNGPIYSKIVQGKDLIADVLPPPILIIESYLLTLKLSTETDPGQQAKLSAELIELKKIMIQGIDIGKNKLYQIGRKRI